jgi:hypothetical protein
MNKRQDFYLPTDAKAALILNTISAASQLHRGISKSTLLIGTEFQVP